MLKYFFLISLVAAAAFALVSSQSDNVIIVRDVNANIETIRAYPIHTIYMDCSNHTFDPSLMMDFVWTAPWHNPNKTDTLLSSFSTEGANKSEPENYLEWKFAASPQLFESSLRLFSNGTLYIAPMRGSFLGNWSCYRIGQEWTLEKKVILKPATYVMDLYVTSLIVGLTSLGGSLILGIFIGSIRYLYENKCSKSARRRKGKPTTLLGVIPVPYEDDDESCDMDDSRDGDGSFSRDVRHPTISIPRPTAEALLREPHLISASDPTNGEHSNRLRSSSSLNADVDLVFIDEQVAEEYQQVLDSLAQSQNDPTRFSERMEELRARLRSDVGRRVKIMRSRMSRAVQTLGSTSALAAQKMRHSFATSVYAMKDQMRSVAELCGSVHVGQTISIVSITRQEDGEEKEVVIKNYTFG